MQSNIWKRIITYLMYALPALLSLADCTLVHAASPLEEAVEISDEIAALTYGFRDGCILHWIILVLIMFYTVYLILRIVRNDRRIEELEE